MRIIYKITFSFLAFLFLNICGYAQDTLSIPSKKRTKYSSVFLNINTLMSKQKTYENSYSSKSADGYLQNVNISPQSNIGIGAGISLNKDIRTIGINNLHVGLVFEINHYMENLKKQGIESDMSYDPGSITQKSNYLVFSLNPEIGYKINLSTKNFLDISTGIGVLSPFFTFGKKDFTNDLGTYSHSQEWSYGQLDFFLYCPIKLIFSTRIGKKEIGFGLKTILNDSYAIPNSNQNFDLPKYTNRTNHNIGFNGISSYSLKTPNDPTKSFVLNFILNFKL